MGGRANKGHGRSWAAVLLGIVAWLVPSAVGAQCVDGRHAAGLQMREQHQDAEAAALFDQIWRERHEPCALARLALAEDVLQRWVDAEAHLEEALRLGQDRWIRHHRSPLQGQLEVIRARLSWLRITGPVGAEVIVTDRPVGVLPLPGPVRVAVGRTVVTLRMPDGASSPREVIVSPGEELAVELYAPSPTARAAAAAAATSGSVEAPPQGAAPPNEPMPPREPAPAGDRPSAARSTHLILGGIAAVLAVAGGGVGVYFHLTRESEGDAYNGDTSPTGCRAILGDPSSPATSRASCEASKAEIFDAPLPWMIAGYATAGVMAVTSIVLFATTPAPRGGVSAWRPRCAPAIGAAGVLCQVTF